MKSTSKKTTSRKEPQTLDVRVSSTGGDDLHAVFLDTEGVLRMVPFIHVNLCFAAGRHHITVGAKMHTISGAFAVMPKETAYMKYNELAAVIANKAAADAEKAEGA